MITDILVGFASMVGGAFVGLLPYLAWSYCMRAFNRPAAARPAMQWMFVVWGALWISQGIRYSIDAMVLHR